MKKAVLIFDMPDTCIQCPCIDEEEYCVAAGKVTEMPLFRMIERPSWCPLIETTKADISRAEMYLNKLEYIRENRLCLED